jgi:hypothetical protein
MLVILGIFLYLHYRNRPTVTTVNHPITQLSPVPAANNGEKKVNETGDSINQQTATDNHGVVPSGISTKSSQWTTSQSGLITVKQPSQNSTVKSGATLFGSASVSQIQYRLVDNQVGVISQGFVSVVHGVFSANINFQAYSSSGRLDVFSTDASGREINEAQVPVSFSQ